VTKGSSLSHIVMLSSTAGGAATWFDPITNGSILSFPILGKRVSLVNSHNAVKRDVASRKQSVVGVVHARVSQAGKRRLINH
jgi:hypothetical protein